MLCPECHIPILKDRCPNCGLKANRPKPAREAKERKAIEPPIQFDVVTQPAATEPPPPGDWKDELRRRLDARAGKVVDAPPEDEREAEEDGRIEPEPDATAARPAPATARTEAAPPLRPKIRIGEAPADFLTKKPLFDYRIQQATSKGPLPNPILPREKRRPQAAPTDRPGAIPQESPPATDDPAVDELPLRSGRAPIGADFDPFLPLRLPAVEKADPVEALFGPEVDLEELAPKRVTRDILASRILSGVIDTVAPALLSSVFTVVAAWVLNFDLFSTLTLRWWLVIWAALFYLNTVFFLVSCGQTPGMQYCELLLKGRDPQPSDDLPVTRVLLRVALFVPVAATVLGLVWALFDPHCRTLVDLISGTDVVRADVD